MKKLICMLTTFLILLSSVCCADDRVIISTEDWEPPVIDESCLEDAPWLLALKVAQEEIGYVEGPLNDQSKYGDWFCGRRVAWCAEFLTWCANEADERYGTNLLKNIYPWYGASKEGAPWFMERGRFVSDNGKIPASNELQWLVGADRYMNEHEYVPFPGDYMWLFYYSRKQGTDHVAIVEGVSRDPDGTIQVHVIEGNNPDKVQRATYALDYKLIYGYGTPVKRAYTNIRLYNTGDDVIQLQKDLETLGFYKPPKSGYKNQVDTTITDAVKRFKRSQKLKVTQVFDLEARKAMEKALAEHEGANKE